MRSRTRTPSWLTALGLAALLLVGTPASALAAEPAPDLAAHTDTARVDTDAPAPPGTDAASVPESAAEPEEPSAPEGGEAEQPGAAEGAETGATPETQEAPEEAADPAPGDGAVDSGAPGASAPGAAALANRIAPSSAADLAPGTYTVTANPYVAGSDAPIGVNVYMSDAGFPPVTPQRNNATLRVAADGTLEVVVPFAQEIFTLQAIGDGPDLRVTDIERGGTIAWGGTTPDPRYPDRIVNVTAVLGNGSGEYSFGGATQYPVPLQVDKHWTVHLSVDFASAVRQVAGDFTQTYSHSASGASVTVAADEGHPAIPALREAELYAASPAADDAGVASALAREFVSTPSFTSWDLGLAAGGADIDLAGGAAITVTVPSAVAKPVAFRVSGGTATRLTPIDSEPGTLSFTSDGLGAFAIVDGDSAAQWEHTKVFSGDVGTTMTYRTTGLADLEFPGMNFEIVDSLGAYNAFLGEDSNSQRAGEALSVAGEGFDDPEVRLYTFGFDLSFENIPGATESKHLAWLGRLGGGRTSLSGTVPASGAGERLFLVSGTVGAGLTSAVELAADRSGGTAAFDIVGRDTDEASPAALIQIPLWNAATQRDGNIDTPQTDATEIAYIAVVREAAIPVAKPAAARDLVYTGAAQSGVAQGTGYTLSARPTAVDAGSYVARASLAEGHVWEDGTTEPVNVTWEIAPATLTASYAGEQVPVNSEPKLAVDISGFVNGETRENAAGFVAPTIAGPAKLVAGKRHTLTPTGGSAKNYRFEYVAGTLTVSERVDPGGWKPGRYRITANLFVPGEKNDILGLTAYMTSPKNPLVAPGDPNYGVPTDPVRDNATLVVGKRGERTLILDLPNPAFTLMQFGAPSKGVSVAGVARDGKSYGPHTGGRITRAVLTLADSQATHTFAGSHVYAAPLDRDKRWDLSLSIDYASARWTSGDTSVTVPGGSQVTPPVLPGKGPGTGSGGHTQQPGQVAPQEGGTLAPGTHTVSANIWFSRDVTGLPLSPHITNGGFPPKDPVAGNATLVVAPDGTGRVTVPVVIQDRILSVRSISGGGITGTAGDGAVTSVTVDLGRIEAGTALISRSMTASVSIGDLAYSIGGPIFGGTREHTWPASFEVNLTGLPTSGGGAIPGFVQAKLSDARAADQAKALEAARKANERSREAGRAESTGAIERSDAAVSGGPSPALVLTGAGLVLLAGAGATLIVRRRSLAAASRTDTTTI